MLPFASATTMQCSHFASTPSCAIRRALDADGVVLPFPRRQPLPRVLIGAADAGQRRRRRIAPHAGDREADAGPDLRQQRVSRRRNLRQLAAEQHEHAVRALGEHALTRAVGPLLVAGQRADVFRPALHDLVRDPSGPGCRSRPAPRRNRRPPSSAAPRRGRPPSTSQIQRQERRRSSSQRPYAWQPP